MRRIFLILLISYLSFLLEFVLFNVGGGLIKPAVTLLPVVYFSLTWGVRYSLVAALFCGLFKDSISVGPFGANMFALMVCAFLTNFVKRYLFHMGYRSLRAFVVFLVTLIYGLVLYGVFVLFTDLAFNSVILYVLVPEVITTTLIAEAMFRLFKKCVLKLSV